MSTDLEAYKVLSERHLNDDRLLNERSSIFIAGSAFLFAGFASLTGDVKWLRMVISVLGILLSVLANRANYRTSKGLGFWDSRQRHIEENSEDEVFKQLRQQFACPSDVYKNVGGRLRNRHIYTWFIPSIFMALWISSFVWTLMNKA